MHTLRRALLGAGIAVAAIVAPMHASAWEPTKPVTFVVPAGTGGGADHIARFIQGVGSKHKLM
jgi:tripartite-type tricarboxylate transporter receptor subunit TctC